MVKVSKTKHITKKGVVKKNPPRNEIIYRVYDDFDEDYSAWYGTEDGIKNYLYEQRDQIPNYNPNGRWADNLERYGLTADDIKVRRK